MIPRDLLKVGDEIVVTKAHVGLAVGRTFTVYSLSNIANDIIYCLEGGYAHAEYIVHATHCMLTSEKALIAPTRSIYEVRVGDRVRGLEQAV